jgi:Zn-dependent protease
MPLKANLVPRSIVVTIAMHDHASWSFGFGRWGGVHVRMHMFFFLFAALTCYLSWWEGKTSGTPQVDRLAVYALLVLTISVLFHELGHLWAARRLGGRLDVLVLVPWGGLTSVQRIRDPHAELLVHLAGPAAQVAACLLTAPLLVSASGNLAGLLNPLAPEQLTVGTTAVVLIKLTFWLNWTLLLVNLLPVFPFDGGAALRAAILVKWPELGRRGASWLVAGLAKTAVLGLALVAFFLPFDDSHGLVPVRFALILLCIFLYFSAQHEDRRAAAEEAEREDALFDDDLSTDLASLESEVERRADPSGPLQRWLDHRRELQQHHQHEQEAEEERTLDEILQRLHQYGRESLSPEDQATLERISARYRSRLSH